MRARPTGPAARWEAGEGEREEGREVAAAAGEAEREVVAAAGEADREEEVVREAAGEEGSSLSGCVTAAGETVAGEAAAAGHRGGDGAEAVGAGEGMEGEVEVEAVAVGDAATEAVGVGDAAAERDTFCIGLSALGSPSPASTSHTHARLSAHTRRRSAHRAAVRACRKDDSG